MWKIHSEILFSRCTVPDARLFRFRWVVVAVVVVTMFLTHALIILPTACTITAACLYRDGVHYVSSRWKSFHAASLVACAVFLFREVVTAAAACTITIAARSILRGKCNGAKSHSCARAGSKEPRAKRGAKIGSAERCDVVVSMR